jgi:uncharacterized RDD family membrane protein YckC
MTTSSGKRNDHEAGGEPPARLPLAEPAQRLVARLIDTLIVGLPVVLVVEGLLPGARSGARPFDTATAFGVAGLYMLYDAVQIAIWGCTVGKRLNGLRVVSEDGEGHVGPLRSIVRAAVFALPIAARPLPVVGVIAGLFWVGNSAAVLEPTRRQAVHDRLARTVVVRVPGWAGP